MLEIVRFPAWAALTLFSIVTIVAVNEERVSQSNNWDLEEKWSISLATISGGLGLIACVLLSIQPEWFSGRTLEAVFIGLCVMAWTFAMPVIMSPKKQLAVNANNAIVDANLYFSSWGSFIAALYMFATSFTSRSSNLMHISPSTRGWVCLLIASLVAVISAVRTYREIPNCDGNRGELCGEFRLGISLSLVSVVLTAGVVVGSLCWAALVQPVALLLGAIAELVIWSTLVGKLTFKGGPGSVVGTLFFVTWISLLVSLGLCLQHIQDVRLYESPAPKKEQNEEAPHWSEDPEASEPKKDDPDSSSSTKLKRGKSSIDESENPRWLEESSKTLREPRAEKSRGGWGFPSLLPKRRSQRSNRDRPEKEEEPYPDNRPSQPSRQQSRENSATTKGLGFPNLLASRTQNSSKVDSPAAMEEGLAPRNPQSVDEEEPRRPVVSSSTREHETFKHETPHQQSAAPPVREDFPKKKKSRRSSSKGNLADSTSTPLMGDNAPTRPKKKKSTNPFDESGTFGGGDENAPNGKKKKRKSSKKKRKSSSSQNKKTSPSGDSERLRESQTSSAVNDEQQPSENQGDVIRTSPAAIQIKARDRNGEESKQSAGSSVNRFETQGRQHETESAHIFPDEQPAQPDRSSTRNVSIEHRHTPRQSPTGGDDIFPDIIERNESNNDNTHFQHHHERQDTRQLPRHSHAVEKGDKFGDGESIPFDELPKEDISEATSIDSVGRQGKTERHWSEEPSDESESNADAKQSWSG